MRYSLFGIQHRVERSTLRRELSSVRYDQVNAILLNEFLKGHQKVQELKKQIEVRSGPRESSDLLEPSEAVRQIVNDP